MTESDSEAEEQAIETGRSKERRNPDEELKGGLERDCQYIDDPRRDALTTEGVPELVGFAVPHHVGFDWLVSCPRPPQACSR